MKPVAILGCGPAGLIAAHTCGALAGHPVSIFSYPKKSVLGGAQFLHEPIPELTDDEPDIEITYRRGGDANGYQTKAYGSGAQPPFVSFDGVEDGMTQPGWNLRKIYDRLWSEWGQHVNASELNGQELQDCLESDMWRLVISTIPLRSLCLKPEDTVQGGHRFTMQTIRIKNVCHAGSEDNTIWYDGSRHHTWFRASRLFGVGSTEWGAQIAAGLPYPMDDAVTVRKPIATSCDCHPPTGNFLKVGRYGRWSKGVLTQDAYRSVAVALHERGMLPIPERPA